MKVILITPSCMEACTIAGLKRHGLVESLISTRNCVIKVCIVSMGSSPMHVYEQAHESKNDFVRLLVLSASP